MSDRKYPLSKIASGDYLLPSNDGRRLWRILYAQDDETGASWMIMRWLGGPIPSIVTERELLDWALWESWDFGYRTRREAIEKALVAV